MILGVGNCAIPFSKRHLFWLLSDDPLLFYIQNTICNHGRSGKSTDGENQYRHLFRRGLELFSWIFRRSEYFGAKNGWFIPRYWGLLDYSSHWTIISNCYSHFECHEGVSRKKSGHLGDSFFGIDGGSHSDISLFGVCCKQIGCSVYQRIHRPHFGTGDPVIRNT